MHALEDAVGARDEAVARQLALQADLIEEQLGRSALAARIPAALRFRFVANRLEIDGELGALEPARDPPIEAELGPLAQERLRRAAAHESASDAIEELLPFCADPATPRAARARLHARVAWLAHRIPDPQRRERHLAILEAERELLDFAPDTAASALLLRIAGDADPPRAAALARQGLAAVLARLHADGAQGLLASLARLGADSPELHACAASARERRAVLRIAQRVAGELLAAREPLARPLDEVLLLFWPDRAEGAALPHDDFAALFAMPVDGPRLVTRREAGAADLPVAGGFAALAPAPATRSETLAAMATRHAPLAAVLLTVVLALICASATAMAARAMRREREALQLRTEFLTTVTHELKTPLAGVRLVAELLAEGHVHDEGERATWLRRLEGEAARLGMLIENVLDLGRSERGEAPHSPERCELVALCEETLALVAALCERDGLELRATLARAPLAAIVDRQAFRQLLLNLLDNARKYGRPPIELSLASHGNEAVLGVRDHGDGVAPSERELVFERFRRGRAHAHGSVPGVGLGLHLARAIAERHGGTLDAQTAPDGHGACFVLRLPLCGEEPTA